jgi:transcriptional regulator with XRE-family HTH domain
VEVAMSQFGKLLRRLRQEKGLSLNDVAKKINSHKGYVSGIENGKVNPPSVKFLRKFARLYHYDEKKLILVAYVEKAPREIREELRRLVFPTGVGGAC